VLIGVLGGIKGLQINRMIAQGEQYLVRWRVTAFGRGK
jgi:hypothetical protein